MQAVAEDKLAAFDPRDDEAWDARCRQDRLSAVAFQPDALRRVTDEVVRRVRSSNAAAVALTGSTARHRRTLISDLDYHVVGRRPSAAGLPGDVDMYASGADRLMSRLLAGDDFAQWTLRFGCILHDAGALRDAARLVVGQSLWPDGAVKLDRLSVLCGVAESLIEMGDRDAAHDQVRASLTSGARGLLLLRGTFPLSRSELAQQLREADREALAAALEATIYGAPELDELSEHLATLQRAARAVAA